MILLYDSLSYIIYENHDMTIVKSTGYSGRNWVSKSQLNDLRPQDSVSSGMPYVWTPYGQWEFQDPKMEVLYHIRPYFLGIFPYIGLIYIYMVASNLAS